MPGRIGVTTERVYTYRGMTSRDVCELQDSVASFVRDSLVKSSGIDEETASKVVEGIKKNPKFFADIISDLKEAQGFFKKDLF